MDADLGPLTIRSVRDLLDRDRDAAYDDEFLIDNVWFDPERAFVMYSQKNALLKRVVDGAREGKRLYVATNSKRVSDVLNAQLKTAAPKAKVWVLNSDTTGEELVRIERINETVLEYDIVVASPALTSGVSIDVDGYFDDVILIAEEGDLPVTDILQMTARVRNPKSKIVHAFIRSTNRGLEENPALILAAWQKRWEWTDTASGISWAETVPYRRGEVDGHGRPVRRAYDDGLVRLMCNVEGQRRQRTNRLREAFESLLDARTIPWVDAQDEDPDKLKETATAWRTAKNRVQDDRADRVANAKDIDIAEAKKIMRRDATRTEKAEAEKAFLKSYYGREVDAEMVVDDEEGRRRQRLDRFVRLRLHAAGLGERTLKQDAATYWHGSRATQTNNAYLGAALYVTLGSYGLRGPVESWSGVRFGKAKAVSGAQELWARREGGEWVNVTEAVCALGKESRKARLQEVLGPLTGHPEIDPLEYLGSILGAIGVHPSVSETRFAEKEDTGAPATIIGTGKDVLPDGRPVETYRIDEDVLMQALTDSEVTFRRERGQPFDPATLFPDDGKALATKAGDTSSATSTATPA